MMVSLYKRSTPRQDVVLRMIEGACRNAAHAHPGAALDDRMARSIAKRAAGTLTSQWSSVLAAPRARSDDEGGHETPRSVTQDRHLETVPEDAAKIGAILGRGGASQIRWRVPVRLICTLAAIIEAAHETMEDA